jgi:hypothetical protein
MEASAIGVVQQTAPGLAHGEEQPALRRREHSWRASTLVVLRLLDLKFIRKQFEKMTA